MSGLGGFSFPSCWDPFWALPFNPKGGIAAVLSVPKVSDCLNMPKKFGSQGSRVSSWHSWMSERSTWGWDSWEKGSSEEQARDPTMWMGVASCIGRFAPRICRLGLTKSGISNILYSIGVDPHACTWNYTINTRFSYHIKIEIYSNYWLELLAILVR